MDFLWGTSISKVRVVRVCQNSMDAGSGVTSCSFLLDTLRLLSDQNNIEGMTLFQRGSTCLELAPEDFLGLEVWNHHTLIILWVLQFGYLSLFRDLRIGDSDWVRS
jgi:hypothetical protein